MRIRFSVHARDSLMDHGIGESDVEAVLMRPQRPGRDGDGNPIYRGTVDGVRIVVVVRKGSQPPFVITVWDE